MRIYTLEEVLEEVNNEYYTDSSMDQSTKLEKCIKNGEVIEINENKFIFTEWEEFGCLWILESMYTVTDKYMKHTGLWHKERYKAIVIKASADYKGIMSIDAAL